MQFPETIILGLTGVSLLTVCAWGSSPSPSTSAALPAQWRAENRIIDLHQHLDYTEALLARAIKVMDASGVGLGIDLTPGTVTRGPKGELSEFETHKKFEDTLFPARWVQYMNLDYQN